MAGYQISKACHYAAPVQPKRLFQKSALHGSFHFLPDLLQSKTTLSRNISRLPCCLNPLLTNEIVFVGTNVFPLYTTLKRFTHVGATNNSCCENECCSTSWPLQFLASTLLPLQNPNAWIFGSVYFGTLRGFYLKIILHVRKPSSWVAAEIYADYVWSSQISQWNAAQNALIRPC